MPKHVFAPSGWPGYELPEGISIEDLPITSPFCVDTRCKAFRDGFAADEQKTPLLGLLKYGTWTVWFYSFWLALFALIYAFYRAHDVLLRRRLRRNAKSHSRNLTRKTFLNDKAKALIRYWTYRRPANSLARTLGLRQISYGTLALLFLGTAFVAILPWPEKRYLRSLSRFGAPPLSVRCAFIIAALTPLTVALAGRVNVVTWITGVGYERLGVWHRGVGWIMWGVATVHTIPHLMAPVEDGGWSMLNQLYARRSRHFSGTMLYGATFGLAVFSLPWMRRRFYEVFKALHGFFVMAYIGCFWWHCWGEHVSPNYIYATVAVLFGTNLIRLVQRHQNLRSFSNLNGFPTTLTQLPENLTRVVVEVPKSLTWKPGQYASLRMPSISLLGNHPFFITNLPEPRQGSSTHEMVFLVRPHAGFTKKLMDAALIPEPEVPRKPRVLRSSRALEKQKSVDNGKAPIRDIEKPRIGDEKSMIKDEKRAEHIECIDHQPDIDRIMVIEEEVGTPISPFAQSDYPLVGMHPLRQKVSVGSFPPRDEITEAKLRALAEKPAGVRFSTQTTQTTQTNWRASASTKRRSSICSLPPMDEITQHKLIAIANKSGIRASRRTIVDGPYGSHHRPYHQIYDNLLFIAAGTGITAIMPHILHITQRLSNQTKDEILTPRRMHLVWIIRETACMSWVERELTTAISTMSERPGPNGCTLTVDIYVTRSPEVFDPPGFPEDGDDNFPVDDELPVLSPEATSPISLDFALDEKKDVRFDIDPEKSGMSLPARPRPVVRRMNDGSRLFDSALNLNVFAYEGGISSRGASVAMRHCRPVIKDVVEGYVAGERALVMGCGPSSLSTELANVVAGLQRRVWNDAMREVALVLERFSL